MPINYDHVRTVHEIYRKTQDDIENGINLQEHLEEIEAGIEVINEMIALSKQKGEDTKGYEALKNDFFYLKWQILEKM